MINQTESYDDAWSRNISTAPPSAWSGEGCSVRTSSARSSSHTCELIARFYIHTVLSGACSVVGFVGNVVSFIVIGRDTETSPVASLLLRSLAFSDGFFLINMLLTFSLHYLLLHARVDVFSNPYWLYFRLYSYPLLFVGQTATIWLTVLVAACRYVAVCLPYHIHDYCNLRVVQRAVAALVVFSVVYNVPRYFEAQVYYSNATSYYVNLTSFGSDKAYRLAYFDIAYYIVCFIVPLLLLTVFNSWLIFAYRAKQRRRALMYGVTGRQSRRREGQEQNLTLVMIAVIVAFLLGNTPARIMQMISDYRVQLCPSALFFLTEISVVLEVLSSSMNFFIYFVIRKLFRRTLARMLCSATGVVPKQTDAENSNQHTMVGVELNDVNTQFRSSDGNVLVLKTSVH